MLKKSWTDLTRRTRRSWSSPRTARSPSWCCWGRISEQSSFWSKISFHQSWAVVVVAQVVEQRHSVGPGLNPGTYLAWLFSVQIRCQFILTGQWTFSKERVIKWWTLFLLLPCFLSSFTTVKFINCNLTMNKEKGKINQKGAGRGPY